MPVPLKLRSFHGTLAAWGLLASTGLSALGNSVVMVAVPWLVLQRTGSAALTGMVAAAAFAPLVVSALLGGALVDRWGRRRSSIAADLLSAAAVAALPLLDVVVGLEILPLVLLVAAGAVFDGPGGAAREALRPAVAARAGWPLERINSRGEAAEGVADLAGPAVAGGLIVAVGAMNTLWCTAALLAAAALATLVLIRPEPTATRRVAQEATATTTATGSTTGASPAVLVRPERYLSAVKVGLRTVWTDRTLRACAVLAMAVVAATAPLAVVVLPAHLRAFGGAGGLAIAATALAAGGIAGALATPALLRRVSRRALMLASLVGIAAALGALTALPGVGGTAVIAACLGVAAGPLRPVLAVVEQERTPEPLRARVIGTTTSLSLAAAPLAFLLAGVLIVAIGLAATVACCAGGAVLAAAYAAWTPGLRDLGVPPPPAGALSPASGRVGAR